MHVVALKQSDLDALVATNDVWQPCQLEHNVACRWRQHSQGGGHRLHVVLDQTAFFASNVVIPEQVKSGAPQRSHRVQDAQHRLGPPRSEEHTSELQSLMRISYAVFRLKKKNKKIT